MSFSGLLSIGVSAVNAFSAGLEALSNNVANSQTDGFREARVNFSDLVASRDASLGGGVGGRVVGGGALAETTRDVNAQGAIARTGEDGDIAILGDGFFVVSEPADADALLIDADALIFTRAGGFRADASGRLVNAAGQFLQGAAIGSVDAGATTNFAIGALETVDLNRAPPLLPGETAEDLGALVSFDVDAAGDVVGTYENGATRRLFTIPLAQFRNAEGLDAAADTAFRATEASGEARLRAPGADGAGRLEHQAVERSTVDIGASFAELIELQRSYGAGARTITVADELWRTLNETAA
ncbi:MAG: flagellar hook-basal body complex protein [Parvularculaceae bacterium]